MAKKKKKKKKNKEIKKKVKKALGFLLPDEAKKWIWGIGLFLLTIIVALSFFDLAGMGGRLLSKSLNFTLGETAIAVPLFLFLLAALIVLSKEYKEVIWPSFFGIVLLIIGISGTLECLNPGVQKGGWLGFISAWPLQKIFGFLVTQIIFWALIGVGLIIFWKLLSRVFKDVGLIIEIEEKEDEEKESFIKKFFEEKDPDFNISTLGEDKKKKKKAKAKSKKSSKKEEKEESESNSSKKSKGKTPPLKLLNEDQGEPNVGNTKKKSKIIKNTLKDFNIPVQMAGVNIGPTVTQYTFKPAEGIKLSKITSLSDDLALALAAHPVRIEAPIPGKSLVGVEIPNEEKTIVGLRGLLERSEFQNSSSHLKLPLGRNVSGEPSYANLGKMPHLLVAGSTGSGKTIFLYSLITSLLYQNTPESLRFILIDPKRVEFSLFNNVPYLLSEVINDPDKAVESLEWLVTEMERRFDLLSENKARDITSYNKKMGKDDRLPYIVIVIDELADLMANKGKEVEKAIVRLAQMARAVGIHLVLATQRPSVEVITGLIKANITARVSFQVASQVDSRTILDMAGAEKLLGAGDMLFLSPELGKTRRIQSAFITQEEVRNIVGHLRDNMDVQKYMEDDLSKSLEEELKESETALGEVDATDDPLYEDAKTLVIRSQKGSASMLQRRLRIGYVRAARLIDTLEGKGIVGPQRGSKAREVYVTNEDETDNLENEDEE